MYLHNADGYYLTRFMTFGFTFAIVKLRGKWGEKIVWLSHVHKRWHFFYDELRKEKISWFVTLCNAVSTHVTAFLDTGRVRGDFAAVCLSFCGHEDKQGHKVQTKILPTSYLLERIDIWCKV